MASPRVKLLATVTGLIILAIALLVLTGKEQKPPNILLIVADDLGNNDLGSFGDGSAPTPNIDKLAHDGVRFTRHYSHATCRPARMALLTGLNASQVAVPPHVRGISPEITTLPEALQKAGYSTHHIGKWHLGHNHPLAEPGRQGFDTWFGFLTALSLKHGNLKQIGKSYHNPWLQENGQAPKQHKGHLTDILTKAAIDKIKQSSKKEKPWFINLWFFAPHKPIQAEKRYSSEFPDNPEGRYLALLAQLDNSIAAILAAIEDTNDMENTIVIFVSDNGGTNQTRDNNYPYYGHKTTFYEGGIRTPLIIFDPNNKRNNSTISEAVYISDIMPTILDLAGVTPPEELSGSSLAPHMYQRPIHQEKTTRFWEFQHIDSNKFGVLSADEELLTYQETQQHYDHEAERFLKPESIFLKENGPAEQYIEWKEKIRVVNISIKPIHENGLLLEGDSFRRTPGFGGWSLQIPLTLGKSSQLNDQIIASQQDQFSIHYSIKNKAFIVQLANNSFYVDATKIDDCGNLLTLSTYYKWSKKPNQSAAYFRLFWGDEELHSESFAIDPSELENSLKATLIGAEQENSSNFPGEIGLPLIHNDFITENPVARYESLTGNTLDDISCKHSIQK